jgi:hypothetical protein
MLKPKDVIVVDMDGNERTYTVTRIPATYAREIVANYPVSALPKIGDYEVNEKMMLKLLSYAYAYTPDGKQIALTTRTLIDNHVPDWEALAKLELEMVNHNTSFFQSGKSSAFFENLTAKATALVTQILTDSSAQSSKTDEQPPTS